MPSRRARLSVLALVGVVVLALAVVWVPRLWSSAKSHFTADVCTVQGYDLDPDQASVAATMIGSVTKFRTALPFRASVLVLMAGLQESKLRNLAPGDGDRDSVGVLQQRPSQGWGTPTQLADVRYATGAFLDKLIKVDNWQTAPLTTVVQQVQISAYPDAYAQHEPEAQELADVFLGTTAQGVTCSYPKPSQVATAATVAGQLQRDLPVNTPATTANGVSVPGAGWATAAYLVASGDRLGLDSVSYAGRTWTRGKGWKADANAANGSVSAVLHTP